MLVLRFFAMTKGVRDGMEGDDFFWCKGMTCQTVTIMFIGLLK